jgi:hypothetical protein
MKLKRKQMNIFSQLRNVSSLIIQSSKITNLLKDAKRINDMNFLNYFWNYGPHSNVLLNID